MRDLAATNVANLATRPSIGTLLSVGTLKSIGTAMSIGTANSVGTAGGAPWRAPARRAVPRRCWAPAWPAPR